MYLTPSMVPTMWDSQVSQPPYCDSSNMKFINCSYITWLTKGQPRRVVWALVLDYRKLLLLLY